MTQISYEKNIIKINGEEIELNEDIRNTIKTDDVIIVHCEYGEMDPTNVVAFDTDGNRLWRIQPLKREGDSAASAVSRVLQREEYVQANSRSQKYYKINLETGETEYQGWFR